MKKILFLLILISPFIFLSYNSLSQCDINTGCAGTATLSIDPPIYDVATSSIILNNIEFGELACTSANYQSGVAVYIYQVLPNGDRMELCNVLNAAPFNVVGSIGISFGPTSFCDGNTVNVGTVNIGPDQGFISCDGAFLELEAALFITDNMSFDPTLGSVYTGLNANEYIVTNLGTLNININNEFPGGGQPLTTASITDFNGSDGPLTVNCGEDVLLDVEGLSRLANCPDYNDLSTGIASELSNEFYYTVNGGTPVIVQSAATGAAGGQLTGPDPAIGNNCYAGILGLYTLEWNSLPADLCDGSVVVVTITTTDVFTGQTVSDDITINYTGATCNTCSVPGCTDPCDPNYNPLATEDDPTLCAGYDDTCNADCTMGPFGGTWDATTCACINETAPVSGCTDDTACNYDPAANCDDGGCQSAPTCNTDPCVGDIEIIDPNDPCECIVDAVQVLGCTDMAACNYEATANCDDNSCDQGNTNCPDPCIEPNPDDGCDLTTDTFDATTCTITNTPNCAAGTSFNPATCECVTDVLDGCTDPCDPAYDPASTNDVLCIGYSTDCNTDCTAGPFGGTWDATTCACINETTPVSGCTDNTACNYDATANCDDNSCQAAPTCNTDPCTGDIEIIDPNDLCACIVDVVQVLGCTDATADNYNPAANCDDGTCSFTMCDDPCAPNFGAAEACEPYSTDCNTDCTLGPFGGTWDAATCSCINEVTPINGCSDSTADNYDPNANCDDGSCIIVCEEEISGAIVVEEGCDVSGITISIIFPDATIINVVTVADGTFSVPGGPFPCGTYTAAFFDLDEVPVCYEETGSTDPISFALDGNENDDVLFLANPNVPTLSQWGLIVLALLLMCVGSVTLMQKRMKENLT